MIGIFGGTFDPIHHGHLRIALDALEALELEQVRLIPLGEAVHRDQPHASAAHRLAMLRTALSGQNRLIADAREIERGGQSYMVDTLASLQNDFPETPLCLLLGSDAFNGFMQWREPELILQQANILVMQRPGYRLPDAPELQALVNGHRCDDLETIRRSDCGKIHFHTVTQLDISSSNIRARIAANTDPAYLLPTSVVDYIRQHGLYR